MMYRTMVTVNLNPCFRQHCGKSELIWLSCQIAFLEWLLILSKQGIIWRMMGVFNAPFILFYKDSSQVFCIQEAEEQKQKVSSCESHLTGRHTQIASCALLFFFFFASNFSIWSVLKKNKDKTNGRTFQ